jgi:hypothetical protein
MGVYFANTGLKAQTSCT